MARRKTKAPKVEQVFNGLTLETWREQNDLLAWAQSEPRLRAVYSVLVNERRRALEFRDPARDTENMMFGQVVGYDKAIEVFEQLVHPKPTISQTSPEPTYPSVDVEPNVFD